MSLNIWAVLAIIVVSLAGVGTAVVTINNRAYDRGVAVRDAEARQQIAEMEKRVAVRLREAEGLSDEAIDCALKRLRNPNAECGK